MISKKLANFLYVFLIITLILFMLFIVLWLKGESKDCLANPLQYYKDKTDTTCYCMTPIFVETPDPFIEDLLKENG